MTKFEIPKELADKVLQLIQDARTSGKLRKGTNEATKSVERNEAKFVIIASDVNPPEIVMHIPMLCDEKKIPYAFVPTKADLGAAAGLPVGTSAIAIANAGEAAKKLAQIAEQIYTIRGVKPEVAKAAPKAEAPKAAEAPAKEKKPRVPKKPKEQKAETKPAEEAKPAEAVVAA